MKIVLFCGGLGMRMREYSETIPKAMVPIGYRPILWHIMKYYAHCGHRDFILCLGYKADVIKNYFLQYDECLSNDFVLSGGKTNLKLLSKDIHDWRITFVDTGLTANLGQRLKAVQKHVKGEKMFLANYTDGLCDVPLPTVIDHLRRSRKIASFVSVRPTASFHIIKAAADGLVTGVEHIARSGVRMNAGFFVFRKEIFDYMEEGEELVEKPFGRLIARRQLMHFPHDGFYACMDTFKEKQVLDDILAGGRAPWAVWNGGGH